MARFKEIVSGIRSCFSLTASERLIIILVLAVFLFGLALRWRHLNREKPEHYKPPARPPAASEAQLLRAGNASRCAERDRDAGGAQELQKQ